MMQGLRILSIDTCKQSPMNSLLDNFFALKFLQPDLLIVMNLLVWKNKRHYMALYITHK